MEKAPKETRRPQTCFIYSLILRIEILWLYRNHNRNLNTFKASLEGQTQGTSLFLCAAVRSIYILLMNAQKFIWPSGWESMTLMKEGLLQCHCTVTLRFELVLSELKAELSIRLPPCPVEMKRCNSIRVSCNLNQPRDFFARKPKNNRVQSHTCAQMSFSDMALTERASRLQSAIDIRLTILPHILGRQTAPVLRCLNVWQYLYNAFEGHLTQ